MEIARRPRHPLRSPVRPRPPRPRNPRCPRRAPGASADARPGRETTPAASPAMSPAASTGRRGGDPSDVHPASLRPRSPGSPTSRPTSRGRPASPDAGRGRRPPAAPGPARVGDRAHRRASALGGSSSTRLELSRAPSPTEARPIRAIPVPEEFVPLPPRATGRPTASTGRRPPPATCRSTSRTPSLERYGQSVEQSVGPRGRFLSYPLDDPRQSNQRNQILQPFFSAGLFAAQIALLPYNLVMDPPVGGRVRPRLLPPRRQDPDRHLLPPPHRRRPAPAGHEVLICRT